MKEIPKRIFIGFLIYSSISLLVSVISFELFRRMEATEKLNSHINTLFNKTVHAIIADIGPRAHLGEGSIALARMLGINPSPRSGGVAEGVTYTAYPGSKTKWPLTNAEIEIKGAEHFAKFNYKEA